MRTFQRILAVPMALTALACLWLLWRQAGSAGLIIGGAALALLAILLLLLGRREGGGLVALGGAIAIAVAGVLLVPAAIPVTAHAIEGASPWSEAAVAKATATHPAFVYFTADWCLTCKVNETSSIDRAEVRAAFKKAGVEVLAADWTNGDPAITRFLDAQGRAGVPLYLWYAPGKPAEELPQVLTPAMLIARAQQAR